MKNFLFSVAGVVVGGIITFLVSRNYYAKTAKETGEQTDALKELLDLAMRAIKAGGYARVYRDENGRATRVVIDVPRMVVEEPERARRVLAAIGIGLEFQPADAES